jgi:hypothetical protein
MQLALPLSLPSVTEKEPHSLLHQAPKPKAFRTHRPHHHAHNMRDYRNAVMP